MKIRLSIIALLLAAAFVAPLLLEDKGDQMFVKMMIFVTGGVIVNFWLGYSACQEDMYLIEMIFVVGFMILLALFILAPFHPACYTGMKIIYFSALGLASILFLGSLRRNLRDGTHRLVFNFRRRSDS